MPLLTPQDFSAKIKEKYPEYKDVDDVELAKKVIAKYPEYKGKVNMLAQSKAEPYQVIKNPENLNPAAKVVNALTKSEQAFGQSIGGALATNSKDMEGFRESAAQNNTLQQQLIQRIKEKRDKGEDTSRLVDVLKEHGELPTEFDINPVIAKTNKQVLGEAGGVLVDIASAGTFGKAVSAVSKAKTIGQGILTGAKAGAGTGALYGGLKGVTTGMEENLSVGGIAKEGAIGAGIGGVAGGVIGGVVGGVTGGIAGRAARQETKAAQEALDAITPKTSELTPTEYDKLLSQKKIAPKTKSTPATYILSEEEKAAAVKYQNLLQGKDPVQNSINITNEIASKDAEVGVFLTENNSIFNSGELKNYVAKQLEGISDVAIPEARIAKLKKLVIDNFVAKLEKNDMKTLWQARKAFDQEIEKAFSGSPTLQNQVKKEFRGAVQEFIAEKTPDSVYSTKMREMTELFNIRDVVNTKAGKEKALNTIQLWIKNNPNKAKALGWGAGLLGAQQAYSMMTN